MADADAIIRAFQNSDSPAAPLVGSGRTADDIIKQFESAEPPPAPAAPASPGIDANAYDPTTGLPMQQEATAGTGLIQKFLDWRQQNAQQLDADLASGNGAAHILMGPAGAGESSLMASLRPKGALADAYANRLLQKATASTEPPAGAPVPAAANDAAPVAGGNPLAPQAATANPLAPPPEAPAVATPTEGPKARLLPVRTPAQADAEADRILRHFAGNGSTKLNTESAIPGSQPTLSQAIEGGNPGIAALERSMRDASPNDFVARETANQSARADHLVSVTGTPADLAAAEAERDAMTAKAKATAFANPQPTDPTPVVQTIDGILASGQGQRTAVAAALKDVRAKLIDDKGVLQTNPEQLYGIRQHINDIISPKAAGTASDARQAARELMTVKASLDPVIEQGAPGFTSYIKQYEELSKPINGMQYLQNLQLTDASGKIQLGRLNTAINGLERQQKLPGARPADSVTDDQLDQLRALRDDFRRDGKQQQGKSLGSNTAQNLGTNGVMSTLGHPLVSTLGFGSMPMTPYVSIPAMAARFGLQKMGDKGQSMVLEALRRKLLNPDQAATSFPQQ